MSEFWSADGASPGRSSGRRGKGTERQPLLEGGDGSDLFDSLMKTAEKKVSDLGRQIESFSRDARLLGTAHDSQNVRKRIKSTVSRVASSMREVHALVKGDLAAAAREDPSQQGRREKDRNELVARLREQMTRFETMSGSIKQKLRTPLPKSAARGGGDEEAGWSAGGGGEDDAGGGADGGFVFHAIEEADVHSEIAAAREEQIDQIFSEVAETHEMMSDLARETGKQAEHIVELEATVVEARDNAAKGVDDLHSAAGHQKAGGCAIWVFLVIAIVVAGGVVGVLAITHHGFDFSKK